MAYNFLDSSPFAAIPIEFSDNETPFDLTMEDKYRECCRVFQKKCREVQKENERLVTRLYRMKRMSKRAEKDVTLVMGRLDRHNPAWRLEPPPPPLFPQSEDINTSKKRRKSVRKPTGKSGKAKEELHGTLPTAQTSGLSGKGEPKTRKRDPNAPKKPPNAFFQYCQEQRSIVLDEIATRLPGEPEPSKQELTRQLAQRWRQMGNSDKQIYVDRYENSKRKYNQDMLFYRMDAQGDGAGHSGVGK
ncbi:high mobility group protein B1 [Phlebotomus argentipes]|uniref:high mobility group protein B1 n=1 Tax=Phlebotomus argentipes TaxID=94469 RepID=UPI0028936550|nr:high mobility group protein B1 [Phlebotomus argentipes]